MKHLIMPPSTRNKSAKHPGACSLRSRIFRKFRGDTGTSLIEFAITVPMLFMVLIGFIQMCMALYSNFCIAEAARDTARWAAVRGSTSCTNAPGLAGCNATAAQIQSYAQGTGYPGIIAGNMAVTTNWLKNSGSMPASWSKCSDDICNQPGNAVQVVIAYPFLFQIPYANPNTFTFTSTAQMVIGQ